MNSGAELLARIRFQLFGGFCECGACSNHADVDWYDRATLDGCVLLTPDEQEKVREFIEFVLSSGMPDWDDVERGEAMVLALLSGEAK